MVRRRVGANDVTAETRFAYLAGFFDGEGNIRIAFNGQGGRRSHYLRISVTQVDPAPLRLLQEAFGGYLYARKERDALDGYNRRPQWEWVHAGPRAARALQSLLPYLVVKAEAARLGLLFQYQRTRRGGSRRLTEWDHAERESFAEAMAVRSDPDMERIA